MTENTPEVENPLNNIRIVLINTQFPGNIGAVARAMKNMGLSRLYLVNPGCQLDKEAFIRATSATNILENVIIADTLSEVISDCHLVVGTSTRDRGMSLPLLTARESGEQIAIEAANAQVAVVFGQESCGMQSEDLQQCNFHGYIPANPEYSSLNLGAAVQTFCYEIFQASEAKSAQPKDYTYQYPETRDMEYFYQHLEKVLMDIDFIIPQHPGQMMQRLRRLFNRARPDEKELNILRGVLSAMEKKSDNNMNKKS
ncbi:MAG: tRNA (cytosine(32)/uridine(32)-2'-O)-methyltransferase TrmJ [gamma proteobacterium symbiont of Bathyaustriella thionipta]|nr:tRNA (cytosine(32)/uridine(32)-2'-O)-methyltransferase TrmJ [gamma proteobacterium symbiont of Bathyaustriella thionipta]MCU7949791.1 tRNA (cytosine(32)/uridine(32)-2'-O)-methyltransferase TrmJ [gamma proteobacterium symbiont of Bathyaustriella thionipta]MCU7954240.1 tRNA (cytosine(32)/uridine(32)-2'-O)-methyltransferase TrmJ [gamma proteobacterium symbiont of Bathyaustriella thionipta]MCU7956385.1 tRNA (cytosine(32)/uridine(32)-2'-O)-methyltransferase TrmJ [gamma proteobacterium symbiont of 